MSEEAAANLTQLIESCRRGEQGASEELYVRVYDELRSIARRQRRVARHGETMQPTVLANEAFLQFARRFPDMPKDQRENRETFFRAVAQAMRMILRDHWRGASAQKRGGGDGAIALGGHDPADGRDKAAQAAEFLALDEALDQLEQYNPRWHEVVMHRYFGGRTIEETAELLDMGTTTVETDWKLARAWLRRALGESNTTAP